MLKCIKCHLIFKELIDKCPECKGDLITMCENDIGSCSHGVVSGTKVCEKCGEFICPTCGSHDVEAISRTTGYYAPLSAFGAGKQAEFKDRKRYDV